MASGGKRRLILLGAVTALGSLAIQIIVPALPLIVQGLGRGPADGQLVIAVYLAGLAAGQLLWAPVADHHGRRPVLLAGLMAFLAGTVVCAVAGGLWPMLAGRLIQAAGASATLVTARAMATDTAPVGEAAAPLAILTGVILISPAVAPVAGGLVAEVGGWRALFWLLAALTLAGGAFATRLLPETRHGDRAPLHPARLWRTYRAVLREPRFLPLALANAMMSGGFFLFLAVSPFLLAAGGATPGQAGLFYSAVASALIAGTLVVPPITRWRPDLLRPFGSAALAVGAVGLIVVAATGGHLIALLAAMAPIAFGNGMTAPALLAEAIDSQRDRASSAASMFGTMQMGGAAVISTLAVRISPTPSVAVAVIGGLVLGALALRDLVGNSPASRH